MNKSSKKLTVILFSLTLVLTSFCQAQYADNIQVVLDNTEPLKYDRGERLPLILWPLINPGELSPEQAEALIPELDQRGVALFAKWTKENREKSLEQALVIGRAQKKWAVRSISML